MAFFNQINNDSTYYEGSNRNGESEGASFYYEEQRKIEDAKEKMLNDAGFSLSYTDFDGNIHDLKPPEGWRMNIEYHRSLGSGYIYDKNNVLRGHILVDKKNEVTINIILYTYFIVDERFISKEEPVVEVYFGTRDRKVHFVVGQLPYDNTRTEGQPPEFYTKKKRLFALAETFGDENYPDWRKPVAYWEFKSIDAINDTMIPINPHTYFNVYSHFTSEEKTIMEVYFGTRDKVYWVAGQLPYDNTRQGQQSPEFYEKKKELIALAETFGNENYPDWRNRYVYWELGREPEKPKKKGKIMKGILDFFRI